MTPLPYRRLPLTATMLALCATAVFAGEAPPTPPAATGEAPAAKALDDYAKEREAHQAGAQQAAAFHYVRGMRAKEENRLPDAVRDLTVAVDYAPDNQEYAAQLNAVRALAGIERDPRSLHIDRMVDEVQVRDQELWNEAQAKKAEGVAAMQAGDFNTADRAFQMALVRLESLPFTSDRRTASLRELETLQQDARTRREARDREVAAQRNRSAADRSRELRDLGLQLERDRIDAMLRRALRARDRRDYDEAILISEQVLKLNRADERAAELLAKCRRERHVYIRQMSADRWDEEHKLLSESIRTAMLPQLELVRYTTEWPEIDARRKAPTHGVEDDGGQWRKDVEKLLDETPITLDFVDEDITEVVAYLQQVSNVNFVLDPRVVAAAPPPVSMPQVKDMKLRFVLEFLTKITGLKYTLRDEAIYISNEEGTRGDLVMRIYDIRDLTHAMTPFPGPTLLIPEPGGQGTSILPPVEPPPPADQDEFIQIIQQVVAPSQWNDANGTAIGPYNGSMVVTQSAAVHAMIDELLRNLRNQRGSQIHVKCKFLNVENSMLEEIGVSWMNYNSSLVVPGTEPTSSSTQNPANQYQSFPPNTGTDAQLGAAWGENRTNQMMTAGRINNQLLGYTSATTLARGGGLNMQTQTWQLASDFWASAIINAVEKERRGNVIFEPDLTLFNGQQAHIVNMNQQSYIADYDVVQGQYDPIISILSYGTVLDVQAIASSNKKYITLTLRPTNAQVAQWRRFGPPVVGFPGGNVVPGGTGIAAGAATSYPMLIPQVSYSAVRTSVTIPDGGSLVIAGMTNGDSRRSHAGVPFLSHIPFLGRLFSSNGRTEAEQRQLIVVQADLILFDEIEDRL